MTPQVLGKISLVATILVLTYVPAPFSWLATVLWYLRNPLHNFCAYVIGFKGLPLWGFGRSATRWADGFNWQINFFLYVLPLPFVSWRRMLEAYVGWANDGRFGIALRRRHD